MSTLAVGDLRAVSLTLRLPWSGVWTAEADVDLGEAGDVPSGRVALRVGQQAYPCTVDPSGSGKFGAKASLRLLGGGGGWGKAVQARDFSNPGGVLSSAVLSATAAEVGEAVVDQAPALLSEHYVRTLGAASRVLAGRDWYVDLSGLTVAGRRPPVPALPGLTVLSYDPGSRTAQAASDEVVVPGTVLADPRFGTLHVRDVEQTWSEAGSTATLWCSPDASALPGAMGRMVQALQSMARETVRPEYLALHRYRVVSQDPLTGALTLQALKVRGPVPDALPVVAWYGVAGMSARVTPGSVALVAFVGEVPAVVGFDGTAALEVAADALKFTVGLGASPVALATGVAAALNAVQAQVTALGSAVAALAADPTHVAPSTTAAVSAAATAVTDGTAALGTALTALVSTKTWSD